MKKIFSIIKFLPIILIIIFSFISAASLIFQGDDFIWYFINDIEEMSGYRFPNGRYFTNFLTYIMVNFPLVNYILYTAALSALIILMANLADHEKKSGVMKYALTFSLFIMLPTSIYSNTITWISGFTNYVISILLTLAYIFFCFRIIFDKNYIPPKIMIILAPILGLAGALCVEHISLYNILFGIFSIIIIFRLRKRFFASNILFLSASIIGFILMMSADAYGGIFNKNPDDTIGIRNVQMSLSDICMQIYQSVAPDYAREFFIMHILIAFCFMFLYYKADKSEWNTSKKRYSKICVYISAMYAAYSLWINCFEDFVLYDFSMKTKALETAFVFIYLISLVYLAFNLLGRNKFLRFTTYLVSSLIVISPFAMVNPVSPRCFLADAVFWILMSGELFFACHEKFAFFRSNELRNLICIISMISGMFMCNMNISNKVWNDIRIEHIKKQINENRKVIEIIELPHGNLVLDDLGRGEVFSWYFLDEIGYTELLFKYYNIDVDKETFNYIYISPVDYNSGLGL